MLKNSKHKVKKFEQVYSVHGVTKSQTQQSDTFTFKVKSVPRFATTWTVSPMGFSRQEYWSGLPFPSPGDLPDPGIKPRSPALQADTLTSEPPGKAIISLYSLCFSQASPSSKHLADTRPHF